MNTGQPPPPGGTGPTGGTGSTGGTTSTSTSTSTSTTSTSTSTGTSYTGTKLLACSSSFLTPALSRATTNNRCIVNSKYTITYTIVTIGNQQFFIPCPLLKYLQEIKNLMQTQSLKKALIEVAKKYNIPIEQSQNINIKRYTYPTVNGRISTPLIQYNSTFKLVKKPDSVQSSTFNNSLNFAEVTNKTYLLGVCNDDTKTFSYNYTDMKLYAGYLLSTLNIEPIEGTRVYCITCRTNDRNLVKTIPGYIKYSNNQLFFIPTISKILLPRYIPYTENTDITILYTSPNLEETIAYNTDTFHKNTIRPDV